MGIEEGLGQQIDCAVDCLDFVVTSVEGNLVTTDCLPKQFDRGKYAPFDYKVGQRYFRNIWTNGEFVVSGETDEAYLVLFPPGSGHAIKVEGGIEAFIEKIQAEGKKNKFNRLMREEKIEARVRTHGYSGQTALLEVALAEKPDWTINGASNPFEAYSMLVNLDDSTARIIGATYQFNTFDGNPDHFRAAKPVQLPQAVLEVAKPREIVGSNDFKPLNKESMSFIRENCYHPSSA